MSVLQSVRGAVGHSAGVAARRDMPVYALTAGVFTLLILFAHSSLRSAGVSLAPSWGDYVLFAFRGTPAPLPDEVKAAFPLEWLLPQIVLAVLIAGPTSVDIGRYGTQVLQRVGSKVSWWIGTWIWVAVCVLGFYTIAACVWLVACLIFGTGSFAPQSGVQMAVTGLDVSPSSGGEVAGVLLCAVVVSLAVSTIQMAVSLLFRPLLGILFVVFYLLASAMVNSPLLIASASMAMRNAAFTSDGVATQETVTICAALCLLVVCAGGLAFRRKDLLPRPE